MQRRNIVDFRRQARSGLGSGGSSGPALLPLEAYVAAGGAAPLAAWSPICKLSSAYVGPIGRTRNSTTTTQADYTPAANVLAASDFSFSGVNATVVTTYDQSGNALDITNANTLQQPKIWDSATGLVMAAGSLPATLHTGGAFDYMGWSRADSLGLTGSPGLTLFCWYVNSTVATHDRHIFWVGSASDGQNWRVGARTSDSTFMIRQGNALGRYFTPTVSATTAGYTVAKRAAGSNVNAAVYRHNAVALAQAATESSTLNIASSITVIGGRNTGGAGFTGHFVAAMLIAEDAGAAPLAALEAFGASLNTLAGL